MKILKKNIIKKHIGPFIFSTLVVTIIFILNHILKLMKLNIPALPLHDAVITTSKNTSKVQEVMEDTFDRFYNTVGASADIQAI